MPCEAGIRRDLALDRHSIEKETSTPATLVLGLQSFSWLLVRHSCAARKSQESISSFHTTEANGSYVK